ncbi:MULTISPECIES: ZPR1 zinc finger domain-containing protein [Methanoculleus]|uniref:ZPR1-related zinc finger protein n=2 Tax=Methanoculleus TaxID=45989 RepID=A3CS17_METMJ|nr:MULTISPECIES: ZPR1 zinc finger domain-containing protein [Methanoculleus]ABN56167.1 ZPR1-related zinc finger protein [Methanoculleus marisnigri JR1]UYU17635.1 ZPR1 zinc finger domain-containing protein [Methanoculleus submarinus]
MRESHPGTCPACGGEIRIVHHRLDIPHFPDILLVSIACDACGFRHTDTIILGEGDPVRWTVRVEEPGDLAIRVARSTTGTIEIPELGLRVEPGTACEGFVTNIEGVLSRFEQAVETILANPESEDERAAALRMVETIAAAREVAFPFTVILEDPAGNSALVSEKAEKMLLDQGEA